MGAVGEGVGIQKRSARALRLSSSSSTGVASPVWGAVGGGTGAGEEVAVTEVVLVGVLVDGTCACSGQISQ